MTRFDRIVRLVPLAVLLASAAWGHGIPQGTFDDIQESIFNHSCALSGCHLNGEQGSLKLAEGSAWAQLLDFGFGKQPANSFAADNLKMRVDPGRPWNSFLVDKLRGHLKFGEKLRMPQDQGALSECAIREIERWILAGAPQTGFVSGDLVHSGLNGCNASYDATCAIDPCDPAQPVLAQPPIPADTVQVYVVSPALSGHDASHEFSVVSAVPAGFVTGIDVFARAGTEHLTLSRTGDTAPLVVARGNPAVDGVQSMSLALPAGFGIPVEANQPLTIRQAVVAGRFTPAGVAEAYVNLRISTAALQAVEPFIDSLGTRALFAPPRSFGGTAGLWPAPPAGATVIALELWTDNRAARGIARGPNGETYSAGGYVIPEGGLEVPPGTGIAYACEHDNTHLSHLPRWGCGAPIALVKGFGLPPPGIPGLASDAGAVPWCDSEADCADCAQAPLVPCCVPANLVGGDGVEDGRCTLVGLRVGGN